MARAAKNPVTGLTEKQEAWCRACIRIGDPNKAYRKVYEIPPDSKTNVTAAVNELLENHQITVRLAELQKMADRRLEVTIDRLAKEMARVGFSDIGDFFDELGNPIPFHLLPQDLRRAVSRIEVDVLLDGKGKDAEMIGHRYKVRLHPKNEALHLMAKWKRMIVDRMEVVDPHDPKNMSLEEIEAEIRANEEALKVIEAARKRSSLPTKKKAPTKA